MPRLCERLAQPPKQSNSFPASTGQDSCRRAVRIVDIDHDSDFAKFGLATQAEQAKILSTYTEPDLLVLDDLFLARRIAEVSAELLQAIVHQRYKLRRSIVVTSNRVVQDWGKYLGDATMGSTILDRLMHRCCMLDFEGKSYRLREAASRIAAPAPTDS